VLDRKNIREMMRNWECRGMGRINERKRLIKCKNEMMELCRILKNKLYMEEEKKRREKKGYIYKNGLGKIRAKRYKMRRNVLYYYI
jgi:hypothetical protein